MSDVLKIRGRHNALRRYRPADDPEVVAVRTELKSAVAEEFITELVADWPPLTLETRAQLASLLLSGRLSPTA